MDQYAGESTLNYPVKKIEAPQVFLLTEYMFSKRLYCLL